MWFTQSLYPEFDVLSDLAIEAAGLIEGSGDFPSAVLGETVAGMERSQWPRTAGELGPWPAGMALALLQL